MSQVDIRHIQSLLPEKSQMRRGQFICTSHGEFSGFAIGNHLPECPACMETKVSEESKKEFLTSRIPHLHSISRVPKRYANAGLREFEEATPDLKNAALQCRAFILEFPSRKGGLIIHGRFGVGKTHLGIAVLRNVINQYGATGQYWTALSLFTHFMSCISHPSMTMESEKERIANLDLLVLDELDNIDMNKDHIVNHIADIIDRRSANCRLTIAISNLAPNELEAIFSARAVDRLVQDGTLISILDAESRRRLAA